MFSSVCAVTFDAGGTLLRPHPSVGEVYAEVAHQHGLDLQVDALNRSFHLAWKAAHLRSRTSGVSEHSEQIWWRQLVRETLGLSLDDDLFENLFQDLWRSFADPHRWRLYDGARDLLEQLKHRGFELYLMSNWDRRLRRVLDGMNLTGLFGQIFISSEWGCEKPDLRFFRRVELETGWLPQEILHVGDSRVHDWEGAGEAGWYRILVTHEPGASRAGESIDRLESLLDYLPETAPNAGRVAQKP